MALYKDNIDASIWAHLRLNHTEAVIKSACHTSSRRIKRLRDAMRQGLRCPKARKAGRPHKLTSDVIDVIHKASVDDPRISSQKIANAIGDSETIPGQMCRRTVDRGRHLLHFRFTHPRKEPLLTPIHKRNRVQFCQRALENITNIDWTKDVVITDESRISLFNDSRRVWFQPGMRNPKAIVRSPKKAQGFMVWAGIGIGFKSKLIFIKGTMDHLTYQIMLRHHRVFEDMEDTARRNGTNIPFFQQDGAKPHTEKTTMAWLRERTNGRLIEGWPANSPDLSPIENLWGILKRKVTEREPKNLKELEKYVKEEYNKISQDTIDKLIAGMNQRFRLCIHHHGECISRFLTRNRLQEGYIIPSDILQPRDIKVENIGTVVKIRGRMTDFRLPETDRRGTEIILTDIDPPEGKSAKTITMKVPDLRPFSPDAEYFITALVKGLPTWLVAGRPKMLISLEFVANIDNPLGIEDVDVDDESEMEWNSELREANGEEEDQ